MTSSGPNSLATGLLKTVISLQYFWSRRKRQRPETSVVVQDNTVCWTSEGSTWLTRILERVLYPLHGDWRFSEKVSALKRKAMT